MAPNGGAITTLVTGLVNTGRRMVSDGTNLYFVSDNAIGKHLIRRIPIVGGAIADLAAEPSTVQLTTFTVSGGSVYYWAGPNDGVTGQIKRVATGGGTVTAMSTNTVKFADDILAVGSRVYWSDFGIFSLETSATGSAPTTHVLKSGGIWLASDGVSMYVTVQGSGFFKFSLSNFAVGTQLDPNDAEEVLLDGNSVYWTSDGVDSSGRFRRGILKALK
jgi:hypothetical protein